MFTLLTLIIVFGLTTSVGFGGTTNSWPVFQSYSLTNATTGTNLVLNPGMEISGTNMPLANWLPYYGLGYTADTNTVHSGTVSMKCSTANATDIHCGYQVITLNQTIPNPIKLSGWSKALNVSGASNADYAVYLDILYTNGTPLFGQSLVGSICTVKLQAGGMMRYRGVSQSCMPGSAPHHHLHFDIGKQARNLLFAHFVCCCTAPT